jgi:hypothetical protein
MAEDTWWSAGTGRGATRLSLGETSRTFGRCAAKESGSVPSGFSALVCPWLACAAELLAL